VITFVQVALIVGAISGGGYAFEMLEKGNNAGGIGSGILAIIGLAGVVALELYVKK
jgi:uncharacterized membrane protein